MEFLTILIIFAILSRLFEAAKGGTKPRPGPPPRRPLPRQPGTTRTDAEAETDAGPVSAADMIPDELWELLTGQKRPPPTPAPTRPAPPAPTRPAPPTPAGPAPRPRAPVQTRSLPAPAGPSDEIRTPRDEEAEIDDFIRSHTRDVGAEIDEALAEQRAVVARRNPPRPAPVRSLETEPLPEPERHRRFHEKIDRPPPPKPKRVTAVQSLGLDSPAALRRAFVLHEILGPPKALEDDGPDR